MSQKSLPDWLDYVERQHFRTIELGLDRVRAVCSALQVKQLVPVILVAGTNGKGSTCAMVEAMLRAAGYRVGLYTSPHLVRYTERIRIDGAEVTEAALCEAFEQVERARGEVPLTYFEFGTLAAWQVFDGAALDVLILEVGMGGRLDAVNVFEPDCAIVTGVALDHMDFLGTTREQIGFEKAGIFRAGTPAICSDPNPPESLVAHAKAIGADLRLIGRDFSFAGDRQQWSFKGVQSRRNSLAYPALRGANQLLNASAALAALEALSERLPVSMQAVREGLMHVELTGRFQVLPGRPGVILDVAHNPQSVGVLAENLASLAYAPETYAVLGMLGDKDIRGAITLIAPRIDHWLLCTLPGPRGLSADALAAHLRAIGVSGDIELTDSPSAGLKRAKERATADDRIVVFGSFLTLADVLPTLDRH
ncbi:bifunctional tetrahydrofolate synthase/dihydrofolate synthase [Niveibacterium sp. 24ML]|uniref:bifunctional tetrahydrofolate synthase/dihydrofolate synthase n=1 Tax=Niveibacterium sp. 24ML TaxID=2985512 RepID=UPI0022717378|nr:bifunctional tetrahydrofolate synthase/dihydrofolate synthase [Niveibacterium sp. 24ML]MCX9155140.1 bifunctional tetrahydrofolate synthase/dihydrofolate synthase [Niveibacterium sp. 24ML]